MTDEQIIEMAKQAGLPEAWISETGILKWSDLEAFAKLVAEHEREACAKVCEDEAWCLKKIAVGTNSSATNNRAIQASNCADEIRARLKEQA